MSDASGRWVLKIKNDSKISFKNPLGEKSHPRSDRDLDLDHVIKYISFEFKHLSSDNRLSNDFFLLERHEKLGERKYVAF